MARKKGTAYPQRAPKNPSTEKARGIFQENAEKRREEHAEIAANYWSRKPKFTDGRAMAIRIAEYIHGQHVLDEPCTSAGLAIACGTTSATITAYRHHDRDGTEEELEDAYIDSIDDEETRAIYLYLTDWAEGKCRVLLSDVVMRADEWMSNERELRLYKQGRVADIFALKALDGWQDDTTPHTVNQTLVINGSEQSAESALAQLGFGRLTDGK